MYYMTTGKPSEIEEMEHQSFSSMLTIRTLLAHTGMPIADYALAWFLVATI